MALEAYDAGLCRCGIPRSVAWHSEMDGWFEVESFVCHACTARGGGDRVVYTMPTDTRPSSKPPLDPFVLGVTTMSD